MFDLKALEAWFVTGSQHLYGDKTLQEVARHSEEIAGALSRSSEIPVKIIPKPVLTTPDAIRQLCAEASSAPECVGVIAWWNNAAYLLKQGR